MWHSFLVEDTVNMPPHSSFQTCILSRASETQLPDGCQEIRREAQTMLSEIYSVSEMKKKKKELLQKVNIIIYGNLNWFI